MHGSRSLRGTAYSKVNGSPTLVVFRFLVLFWLCPLFGGSGFKLAQFVQTLVLFGVSTAEIRVVDVITSGVMLWIEFLVST